MSLSVDYLYKFSLKLVRKNMAGGLSSDEFQYHFNDSQGGHMSDLLGRFQLRNNGKEAGNTGLIQNETIIQKISPFIKNASISISSGIGSKPSDFLYRLALRINGRDVYKIDHNQIAAANNSVIDIPSAAANIYYFVEYNGAYTFFPSSVSAASIDYVSVPPDVVWGYTFDGNGRQVYNSGSSTQSLWSDDDNREIVRRMLKTIGVSLKDKDFENFGQSVITTGE
jgi:hypothetical protein